MKIRKAKKEDLKEIGKLVYKTFKKNVTKGTKKGINNYLKNVKKDYSTDEIISRSPLFFMAEINGKIIGVLRGSAKQIGHFFVDSKYQGKGIGWRLYKKYEKDAKKKNVKKIKINSSLYAVPFYQRQGYKKIGKFKIMHGIKVQVLQKRLK